MKNKFIHALNEIKTDKVSARDNLLLKMGVNNKKIKDIPILIENAVNVVINPYFVAKFHSQYGFPKEMTLELLKERGYITEEYWSEWCDFWFNSFIKIGHNILCDSKKYYEELNKQKI